MSDKQDKPADLMEEESNLVNDEEQVVDSEVVAEADTEQAQVEPELVEEAEIEDPLQGLGLVKQLSEAQAEIANLQDQMLRTVADAQNTKRRAEQDVTKARKFGTEKFANEMLPVVDSLAMALQSGADSDNEAVKSLNEGVEMTLKMLLTALEKFNVEQVDPQQGEAFNPELHQAMSMVDGGEAESNTVVAVMQKGFTISGRLLRPAMVMVAK